MNIPRYIDSSEKEDIQSIDAHLYGGIPQEDIDNIPNFWEVFPNLKNQMFGYYSKGFYKLLVNKDEVHKTVCENAEFLSNTEGISDIQNLSSYSINGVSMSFSSEKTGNISIKSSIYSELVSVGLISRIM